MGTHGAGPFFAVVGLEDQAAPLRPEAIQGGDDVLEMHGWQRLRRQGLVFPQPLAREASQCHPPKRLALPCLPAMPLAGQCQLKLTTRR